MKLLSVKIGNATDVGWQFPQIHFKRLNLFVGESASGKSTLLNFLFNVGLKVVQDAGEILGYVQFEFEENGIRYLWEMNCLRKKPDEKPIINKENLWKYPVGDVPIKLLERTSEFFKVNDESVPPMPPEQIGIYLFSEAPEIKPVHDAFSSIMRRDFAADELNRAVQSQVINEEFLAKQRKSKSLKEIWKNSALTLSSRLYLLQACLPDVYKTVIAAYRDVFPFVERFEFKDLSKTEAGFGVQGRVPALHVKDKNAENLVSIQNLSSGMKKALLIITDVLMLPEGTVYLLDEYENSLGMNAINLLPIGFCVGPSLQVY